MAGNVSKSVKSSRRFESFGPSNPKARFGNLFARLNFAEEREVKMKEDDKILSGGGIHLFTRLRKINNQFTKDLFGGIEERKDKIAKEYAQQYIDNKDNVFSITNDALNAAQAIKAGSISNSIDSIRSRKNNKEGKRLGEISAASRYLLKHNDTIDVKKAILNRQYEDLLNEKILEEYQINQAVNFKFAPRYNAVVRLQSNPIKFESARSAFVKDYATHILKNETQYNEMIVAFEASNQSAKAEKLKADIRLAKECNEKIENIAILYAKFSNNGGKTPANQLALDTAINELKTLEDEMFKKYREDIKSFQFNPIDSGRSEKILSKLEKRKQTLQQLQKDLDEQGQLSKDMLSKLSSEQHKLLQGAITKIEDHVKQNQAQIAQHQKILQDMQKKPTENAENIKKIQEEIKKSEGHIERGNAEAQEIIEILDLSERLQRYSIGQDFNSGPQLASDYMSFLEKKEAKDPTTLLPKEVELLKEYKANQSNPATKDNPIPQAFESKILSEAPECMNENKMIKGQELDGVGRGSLEYTERALDFATQYLSSTRANLKSGYNAKGNVSSDQCDDLVDTKRHIKGVAHAVKNLQKYKNPKDREMATFQLFASIYTAEYGDDKDLFKTKEAMAKGITLESIANDPEKALAFNKMKTEIIMRDKEKAEIAKYGKSSFAKTEDHIPSKANNSLHETTINVEPISHSNAKPISNAPTITVEPTSAPKPSQPPKFSVKSVPSR